MKQLSLSTEDFAYHWRNLEELDPDQLVCDLNLSTEELLYAFTVRAREFIEDEFG